MYFNEFIFRKTANMRKKSEVSYIKMIFKILLLTPDIYFRSYIL